MPDGWYPHQPGDAFYELDWEFLRGHPDTLERHWELAWREGRAWGGVSRDRPDRSRSSASLRWWSHRYRFSSNSALLKRVASTAALASTEQRRCVSICSALPCQDSFKGGTSRGPAPLSNQSPADLDEGPVQISGRQGCQRRARCSGRDRQRWPSDTGRQHRAAPVRHLRRHWQSCTACRLARGRWKPRANQRTGA